MNIYSVSRNFNSMLPDTRSLTPSNNSFIKTRSRLTFYAQIICLFIVIITSVVNISLDNQSTFWISTLTLCIGSLLPNPRLPKEKHEKGAASP